jgi:hypothetical protein
MKQCKKCSQTKQSSEFYPDPRNKDGCMSQCKECNKAAGRKYHADNREVQRKNRINYNLKSKYNMTIECRDRMLVSCGYRCEICSSKVTTPTSKNESGVANIDHCHTTGKVRGILCGPCNRAIGLLQDSPELLTKASNYLKERT